LSIWNELQDLRKKKAELEFQVHSLEEKERTLLERTQLMDEQLQIQQLEDRLKTKHDTVEQLEIKIEEMERRIKGNGNKAQYTHPEGEEQREESNKATYYFPR